MEGVKEKYRGVFEIQRSGDKTSSGEIGLDIRIHASPKVGQDQVSGGVRTFFLEQSQTKLVKVNSRNKHCYDQNKLSKYMCTYT